eukprot:Lankesteria_metandrocarpae@DN3412_c1_g1_i1.p1
MGGGHTVMGGGHTAMGSGHTAMGGGHTVMGVYGDHGNSFSSGSTTARQQPSFHLDSQAQQNRAEQQQQLFATADKSSNVQLPATNTNNAAGFVGVTRHSARPVLPSLQQPSGITTPNSNLTAASTHSATVSQSMSGAKSPLQPGGSHLQGRQHMTVPANHLPAGRPITAQNTYTTTAADKHNTKTI